MRYCCNCLQKPLRGKWTIVNSLPSPWKRGYNQHNPFMGVPTNSQGLNNDQEQCFSQWTPGRLVQAVDDPPRY